LKQVLRKRQDIAFYIKLFPLKRIHPESYEKSKAIFCARSLKLLEQAFMGKPLPPAPEDCDTSALDASIAQAEALGVRSTPTIILPDGRKVSGFRNAEALIQMIDEAARYLQRQGIEQAPQEAP